MEAFLSGPVLSIVLCILAGIALRYALFFRTGSDRDDQTPEYLGRIDGLSAEKKKLQTELRDVRAELADLEEINQSLQDSNRQLHDANRVAQASREEAARLLQDRERQLNETHRNAQRVEREYSALKNLQRELKDQSARQGQSVAEIEQALREMRKANVRQESELNTMRISAQQLRTERDDIRRALEEAREQAVRVDEDMHRINHQLAIVTSDAELIPTLQQEKDRLHQELVAAHTELSGLRQNNNQASMSLTDAEQQIAELKRNVANYQAKFQELHDGKSALSAEHTAVEQELRKAQSSVDQLRRDLEMLLAENSQLKTLCQEYDRESADMSHQLEHVCHERDAHAAKTHALAVELETTRESLQNLQTQLTTVSHDRDSLSARDRERETIEATLKETSDLLSATRTSLEQLQRQHQAVLSELKVSRDSVGSMSNDVANWRQQYEGIVVELNETRGLLVEERQARVDDSESRTILEGERTSLLETLQREKQRRLRSESELETVSRELDGLRTQLQDLDRLQQVHQTTVERLTEAEQQLATLTRNRESLQTQLTEVEQQLTATTRDRELLQSQLTEREHELAAFHQSIEQLRAHQQELSIALEREHTERISVQGELSKHLHALDRIRIDSQSIENLLERQVSLQASLQEHADRLRKVTQPAPIPSNRRTDVTSDQEGEPHLLAFPSDGRTEVVVVRGAHQDPILGTVYLERPTHCDDLSRISGMGEVIEQKLNRLGIYTFAQVMSWDREAVQHVAQRLACKDRIVRERWVEQARMLYSEKLRGSVAQRKAA